MDSTITSRGELSVLLRARLDRSRSLSDLCFFLPQASGGYDYPPASASSEQGWSRGRLGWSFAQLGGRSASVRSRRRDEVALA